jgi:hypothetical protein
MSFFGFPLHIWEEKGFPLFFPKKLVVRKGGGYFHQQLLPLKILNNCKWGFLFPPFWFSPIPPMLRNHSPQKKSNFDDFTSSQALSHTHNKVSKLEDVKSAMDLGPVADIISPPLPAPSPQLAMSHVISCNKWQEIDVVHNCSYNESGWGGREIDRETDRQTEV